MKVPTDLAISPRGDMTAKIIDGMAIARLVRAEIRERAHALVVQHDV
jgi:hypothetical protein